MSIQEATDERIAAGDALKRSFFLQSACASIIVMIIMSFASPFKEIGTTLTFLFFGSSILIRLMRYKKKYPVNEEEWMP